MEGPLSKILFTDLPPRTRGRQSFFHDFIDDLKEQKKKDPDKWAPVKSYDNAVSAASMASNLRKRFGDLGFEFASRTDEGKSVVFARFVG